MTTFIAILRGINVSGQKLINMNEFKNFLIDLNFKNVKTYIQSGNIIFNYPNIQSQILSELIEKKIFEKYKFKVPVIIRTLEEFKIGIENNSFLKDKNIDTNKLHITFLSAIPNKELTSKIQQNDFLPDKFKIIHKEIYVYCSNGYGSSKLNNNFFEKKLGLTASTRNIKTVHAILKIACS